MFRFFPSLSHFFRRLSSADLDAVSRRDWDWRSFASFVCSVARRVYPSSATRALEHVAFLISSRFGVFHICPPLLRAILHTHQGYSVRAVARIPSPELSSDLLLCNPVHRQSLACSLGRLSTESLHAVLPRHCFPTLQPTSSVRQDS